MDGSLGQRAVGDRPLEIDDDGFGDADRRAVRRVERGGGAKTGGPRYGAGFWPAGVSSAAVDDGPGNGPDSGGRKGFGAVESGTVRGSPGVGTGICGSAEADGAVSTVTAASAAVIMAINGLGGGHRMRAFSLPLVAGRCSRRLTTICCYVVS